MMAEVSPGGVLLCVWGRSLGSEGASHATVHSENCFEERKQHAQRQKKGQQDVCKVLQEACAARAVNPGEDACDCFFVTVLFCVS